MVALTLRRDRQGPEGAAARPPRRWPAAGHRSSSWPTQIGHELPATDATSLGAWFVEAADSGSLERYLETFAHTVAVMQTPEALHRVAYECALDLAADGVVYAESRFAPEQHLARGLALPEVVEAVLAGFADGCAAAAAAGRPIRIGTLLTAMRHAARSMEIAELAVRYRDTRRGRLRHRRCRGRLPAHPAPGRVRVPAAGELPLHHPRRRGVRAAEHLAGDPVVRRGPARPRRAHRRRHLRRRASWAGSPRTCATSASRWSCARRPTCRPARPRRSASTRSGCCAICGSGSRSTPTTG